MYAIVVIRVYLLIYWAIIIWLLFKYLPIILKNTYYKRLQDLKNLGALKNVYLFRKVGRLVE